MSQYANVRIQFANVLICQCANDGYLRICRMVSGFPGISVHSGIDANELQQYANVLYQFVNELICQCANDGY